MKKTSVFSVLCLGVSVLGFCQQQMDTLAIQKLDEVVITDSRFAIKKENSGKTIIKITAKELEQNQGRTIAELINTKSGITINGSQSNAGQNLSTFVRGGQNRQVMVLIDGIALSDPSQIENNFDLQFLALDQIESIEILKGAASALYGSRASTAVINISLKKASEDKLKVSLSSFVATNNSQNESRVDIADFTNSVGINGSINRFSYLLNFSNKFTEGLSAVRAPEGFPNNQSDQFSKISGHLKVGYQFSEKFDITLFGNLDKYKTGFDDGFFFADANNSLYNEQYRIGISPKFNYEKGSIHINAAINTIKRDFESSFPTKFEAQSVVVDAFNKYKFSGEFYSIIGLNYVNTEMDSFSIPFGASNLEPSIVSNSANDTSIDPYINFTYLSSFGLNINAGARLNNHSEYGSHFVYNLNPSYVISLKENSIKILSSYSTAFITPSLFQLFAPDFGNVNLQPQEDTTIELGISLNLHKKLECSAIYFNRNQENFIDFVVLDFDTFESEYQNVTDSFNVNGAEMELSYKPTEALNFSSNYTFTERKDGSLFRIPKHKINANLAYTFRSSTLIALDFQYNSERTSPFFNDEFTANRILESYSLVNLSFNRAIIKDRLKFYASVNNIFNKDYEELYRFSTLGRNMRVGISLIL